MAIQDLETTIHVDNPDPTAAVVPSPTRGCLCLPCFSGRRSSSSSSPAASFAGLVWWERISSVHGGEHRWWARGVWALRKVREWSEIVAGPKWKTFIRRLNRNRAGSGSGNGKFQYDPLSYSLNFDEGPGYHGNSDEEAFPPRYAVVSGEPRGDDVAVFKN